MYFCNFVRTPHINMMMMTIALMLMMMIIYSCWWWWSHSIQMMMIMNVAIHEDQRTHHCRIFDNSNVENAQQQWTALMKWPQHWWGGQSKIWSILASGTNIRWVVHSIHLLELLSNRCDLCVLGLFHLCGIGSPKIAGDQRIVDYRSKQLLNDIWIYG